MMDYNTTLKAHQEIEVAKGRIVSGDYIAARRKLLEVKRYFPAFDDISGMIAVCDILFSAGLGFLGCRTDCYWVLQLSPEASESDIEYQYNKFTDLLEPIKNNFPGTASALKIIWHAFLVLSDPEKRSMFDKKRAARLGIYESENSPETHAVNSQQGYLVTENLAQKEENSLSPRRCRRTAYETLDGNNYASSSIQILSKSMTDYLGERQVHDAELSIQADFTNPRVVDRKPANSIPFSVGSDGFTEKLSLAMTSMAGKSCDQYQFNFNNFRKAEAFAVGQIWATYDEEDMPRRYAQIIGIDKSPFRLQISWLKPAPIAVNERRWCEVGLPVVCGPFYVDRNKTTVIEPTLFSHMVSRYASEQVEIYPKKGEIWAVYKDWKPIEWCLNPEARKGCTLQIVEVSCNSSIETDVLVLVLENVEGFKNAYKRCTDNGSECPTRIPKNNWLMFSHCIPAYRFVGREMGGIFDGMFALDPLAVPNVLDCIMINGSSPDSTFKLNNTMPPLLPSDAGSKPLKLKWSVKEFASDQIWAVYDGPDLMPRRYVVVNNVVSWGEVCVTYLEPQPVLDDDIYWVEEKLPLVCGLFRAGETTLNLGLSRFSHIVKCEQSTDKSLYMIYPKAGEIWAIYRDWNSRLKHVDITRCQCKIVEIVTCFSEDSGLIAASLEQVPGCKTFFQRQLCNGFELIRTVPRTEMLSFSHQIPAFTVPGVEIHGIPKGSWHLEPDALPPNFSPTSNINL